MPFKTKPNELPDLDPEVNITIYFFIFASTNFDSTVVAWILTCMMLPSVLEPVQLDPGLQETRVQRVEA